MDPNGSQRTLWNLNEISKGDKKSSNTVLMSLYLSPCLCRHHLQEKYPDQRQTYSQTNDQVIKSGQTDIQMDKERGAKC